jgi:hypothetical protein
VRDGLSTALVVIIIVWSFGRNRLQNLSVVPPLWNNSFCVRCRGAPNTKKPIQKAWVPESNKNKTPRPHTIHIILLLWLFFFCCLWSEMGKVGTRYLMLQSWLVSTFVMLLQSPLFVVAKCHFWMKKTAEKSTFNFRLLTIRVTSSGCHLIWSYVYLSISRLCVRHKFSFHPMDGWYVGTFSIDFSYLYLLLLVPLSLI